MFARILFPTDFSAYTDTVFACLPDLKTAGLREVVLLSVIHSNDVPMPETVNRESLEYWHWSLGEKLNVVKMALEGKELRVLIRIEYGNPAEQIVRVAEDERVEMIMIGAHGATASQELLIGSTAYEVVRRATLPVLLQKFEAIRNMGHLKCHQACEQMFKRVLFPTDFSDSAEAAFQLIKRLGAAGTKEVIVLNVRKERTKKDRPIEQVAEHDNRDAERLETLCKALSMYGMDAKFILRHGIPFHETLKAADEMDSSMIVLGSHGRSAVREMLAGSTFENVVRLSRQPVLVVRQHEVAYKSREIM